MIKITQWECGIMKCHNCGNEVSANNAFCDNCGQPVAHDRKERIFCGNCGAEVDEDADFCGECGNPIHNTSEELQQYIFCGNCGMRMPANETICHNCGCSLYGTDTDIEHRSSKKRIIAISAVIIFFVAASALSIGYIFSSRLEYDSTASDESFITVTPAATETFFPQETLAPMTTPIISPDPSMNGSQEIMHNNVQFTTYYVVNCKENISLRETPSTSAKVLKTISLGEPVSYVEPVQNGFAKVIYNGTTGYALQSYLSTTPPSRTNINDSGTQSRESNAAENETNANSVVSKPSYNTYNDTDYRFSCYYPAHFQVYLEDNDFMRYTLRAADNTATLKICATKNTSNLSVKTVSDNFKSTYPGSVDYENSGDDWCVARTYNAGIYHYAYFTLTDGMIRGFELHFDGNYLDIYDGYVNDIYNSLQFY